MKKILIVDDDSTNREFIHTLCEDYAKEHQQQWHIFEAENGEEALSIYGSEELDIIFMDIIMPGINGIDAVREIRAVDSTTMIIAISATEDTQYQNEILSLGAEDYIQKPVVSSIFFKRLENYLNIYESRCNKSNYEQYNPMSINLYTEHLYPTVQTFFINNEDALSLVWEEMLVKNTLDNNHKNFSDMFRNIYSLGMTMLNRNFVFHITIEQDEDSHYLTLNNMNMLTPEFVTTKLSKNYSEGEYQLVGSYLSFKIPRENLETTPEIIEPQQSICTTTDKENLQEQQIIFDAMSEEHLSSLEQFARQLNTHMLFLRNSELSEDDVNEILEVLQEVSELLSRYSELVSISDIFEELASMIEENTISFREHSKEMAELFYAFVLDFHLWIDKLFHEGTSNLHFLDDSFKANVRMIQNFLVDEEEVDVDLDDIFDF